MTKPKLAQPWNMASVRSRTTPRVYKPCAPVGDPELAMSYDGTDVCRCCGHHLCSCEQPMTPRHRWGSKTSSQLVAERQAQVTLTQPVYQFRLKMSTMDDLHAEALLEDKQREAAARQVALDEMRRPRLDHELQRAELERFQAGFVPTAKPEPREYQLPAAHEPPLFNVNRCANCRGVYSGSLNACPECAQRLQHSPAMTLEAARHHLKQEAALHRAMQEGELYLAAVEAGLQKSTVRETIDSINKLTWPDIYK